LGNNQGDYYLNKPTVAAATHTAGDCVTRGCVRTHARSVRLLMVEHPRAAPPMPYPSCAGLTTLAYAFALGARSPITAARD
jgi:hypothetical protein